LDYLNVGWLGVFIAPTTKLAVWWRLTVVWCTRQSVGTPDMHSRVSGVPAWAFLTSARAGAHSMRCR
jgi:hypothetical protein